MKVHNKQKKVLIFLSVLVVVQAIWFGVVQYFVEKTQIKTTATVIRMVNLGNTCNYANHRGGVLCDSSDRLYPVYEYYDLKGTRYEKEDQYLSDFKQNNPLRLVMGKNVGDKVTAYYTKDKPEEVSFMGNPFSYAVWLTPLYLVVMVAFGFGVFSLLAKLRLVVTSK